MRMRYALLTLLFIQSSTTLFCFKCQYLETRRVRVEVVNSVNYGDVERISSILNNSSDVVLISEDIDVKNLKKQLEAKMGLVFRYLDITALMQRLSANEISFFLSQFLSVDPEPFLIKGLEVLLERDETREELIKMLDSHHKIVAVTGMSGYRKIEADIEIAEKLNFVLSDREIDLAGKKVAVIGASGFLGGKIYEMLSSRECDLVGTSFSNTESGFIHLDITSEVNVREFLDTHSPDIVIYAAAVASPEESQEGRERTHTINAEALKWIGENFSGKFVYISTDYVFDGENPPYATGSVRNPLNYYGETKVEGEDIAQNSFVDAIVVRPSILYGYNSASGEIIVGTNSLNGLLNGEEIEVDNEQIRYPVLADDVARSILRLLSNDASGVFHLGGRDAATKYQLIVKLVEELGLDSIEHVKAIISTGNLIRPHNPRLILSDTSYFIEDGIVQIVNQIDSP